MRGTKPHAVCRRGRLAPESHLEACLPVEALARRNANTRSCIAGFLWCPPEKQLETSFHLSCFLAFLLSFFPALTPLFLAFLAFPPSCQTRKRRYRLQHRLQLQRKSGTKKPNHQANPSSVASFVPPRWSAPNLTGFLTLPSHPATLRSTTTFYSPPPFAPLFYPSHQSAVLSTQYGSENAGCYLRSQKRGYQEQKAERRGSQVPTTH